MSERPEEPTALGPGARERAAIYKRLLRTLRWIREFTDQNAIDELIQRAMKEIGDLAALESENGQGAN